MKWRASGKIIDQPKNNKKRWRRFFLKFAVGYGLVCLTLYFQQQRLMFFPRRQLEHTPALYDLAHEEVWIPIFGEKQKAEAIHGWWIPAHQPDAPVMLYLHHNGINIGANVSQALQFHELGYSVFLFDYRGFGQSPGNFPNETQVYQDAQIAWDYLTQQREIAPQEIVIYGHSIGSAVAVDLAAQHPEAGALIIQSALTSMHDMTKRFGIYWLFPVDLLLTQRFESIAKIRSVRMPVLVLVGTADIQIPVSMGERLHEAAPEFKQLVVIQGGGHDNHMAPQYQQEVKRMLPRYEQDLAERCA